MQKWVERNGSKERMISGIRCEVRELDEFLEVMREAIDDVHSTRKEGKEAQTEGDRKKKASHLEEEGQKTHMRMIHSQLGARLLLADIFFS